MKIERKIYAVVLVSILLAAGILSTIATRTITDTGDTVDTFIRNSKGNYWTATGDATTNINAAITDLGGLPGTVHLPGGTIYYNSDINIGSNCHLMGAGKYSTILRLSGNTATTSVQIDNKRNIVISDMTFHGNNSLSGGAQTNSNTLDINDCDNLTMRDIRVIYSSGEACEMSYVKNFTISNYDVSFVYSTLGVHHGLALTGCSNGTIDIMKANWITGDVVDVEQINNITFSNIVARNISDDGFKINLNSDNLTMNNIDIRTLGSEGSDHYGMKFWSTGGVIKNIIINNAILHCSGAPIWFGGTGTIKNIRVTGFVFSSQYGDAGSGIQSDATTCNNISFCNGVITNTSNRGISLTGTRDFSFTDVDVYHYRYNAVYLLRSNHTSFIGCTFRNSLSDSNLVIVSGCSNLTIAHCDMSNYVGTGYGAINFTGAKCRDFHITDNNIYGHQYCISIPGTTGHTKFIITGNICYYGAGHSAIVDHSATAAANNVTANNLV